MIKFAEYLAEATKDNTDKIKIEGTVFGYKKPYAQNDIDAKDIDILPRLKPGDSHSNLNEWFLVHRRNLP